MPLPVLPSFVDLHAEHAGRPYDYGTDGNYKYIVLMTDGRANSTPDYRTDRLPFEYIASSQYNGKTHRDANGKTFDNNRVFSQFRRICEAVKKPKRNVRVFTIGFALQDGDDMKTMLRDCASTAGDYFDVDGDGLQDAFDKIAAEIERVKIVS